MTKEKGKNFTYKILYVFLMFLIRKIRLKQKWDSACTQLKKHKRRIKKNWKKKVTNQSSRIQKIKKSKKEKKKDRIPLLTLSAMSKSMAWNIY